MKKFSQNGFTVIELLVAIGIFSIIVTIAIGGFTAALHSQREVSSLISAQSNVSLALEQIAREVRTGYLFCHTTGSNTALAACGCTVSAGAPWTCTALDYYNAQSLHVEYALKNNALQKSVDGGATFTPVSGQGVSVKYLKFILRGNLEGDNWTPRVTITMGITPSSTDNSVKNDVFNLETTVSGRTIDCTTVGGTLAC